MTKTLLYTVKLLKVELIIENVFRVNHPLAYHKSKIQTRLKKKTRLSERLVSLSIMEAQIEDPLKPLNIIVL